MRKDTIDLDQLYPQPVAPFDMSGINAAVNFYHSAAQLAGMADLLNSDPAALIAQLFHDSPAKTHAMSQPPATLIQVAQAAAGVGQLIPGIGQIIAALGGIFNAFH